MVAKNKGGRPKSAMTESQIQKLCEGFAKGLNDKEAMLYANVKSSSFYAYQQENPEFLERKEALKENLKMKAKLVLEESINKGNTIDAKWFLERKVKDEYSLKQEVESINYNLNKEVTDMTDEELDDLINKG